MSREKTPKNKAEGEGKSKSSEKGFKVKEFAEKKVAEIRAKVGEIESNISNFEASLEGKEDLPSNFVKRRALEPLKKIEVDLVGVLSNFEQAINKSLKTKGKARTKKGEINDAFSEVESNIVIFEKEVEEIIQTIEHRLAENDASGSEEGEGQAKLDEPQEKTQVETVSQELGDGIEGIKNIDDVRQIFDGKRASINQKFNSTELNIKEIDDFLRELDVLGNKLEEVLKGRESQGSRNLFSDIEETKKRLNDFRDSLENEAEPEQGEAEPEQGEAEPEQGEAEPEQGEAEPEQGEPEQGEPEQGEPEQTEQQAAPEPGEVPAGSEEPGEALTYQEIMKRFKVDLSPESISGDLEFKITEKGINLSEDSKNKILGLLNNREGIEDNDKENILNKILMSLEGLADQEAAAILNKGKKWKLIAATSFVGFGVSMATIPIRALGIGSLVGAGMTATGAVAGASFGALRGRVMDYLNPKIAKLKSDKPKDFEKARKKALKALTKEDKQDLLKLLAVQSIQSSFLEKKLDLANLSEEEKKNINLEGYKAKAKEVLEASNENMEDGEKEKAANALAILAQVSNDNNRRVSDAFEEKTKGRKLSGAARGALMGGLIGGTADMARTFASGIPGVSSVAAGAIGGAVFGATLKNMIDSSEIKEKEKTVLKDIETITKQSKETSMNISGQLPKVKAYLESGILDKYPLHREQAKSILMQALMAGPQDITKQKTDEAFEEVEKKFKSGDIRTAIKNTLAYTGGVLMGATMGVAAARATEYVKEALSDSDISEIKFHNAKIQQVGTDKSGVVQPQGPNIDNAFGKGATPDTIAAKYGLDVNQLDFDGDKTIEMSDILSAQGKALNVSGLEEPLSAADFETLKNINAINPELAKLIMNDGELSGQEVMIARADGLQLPQKLALLKMGDSSTQREIYDLAMKVQSPDLRADLDLDNSIEELQREVGRINAYTIEVGTKDGNSTVNNFTRAISRAAESSSTPTQDAFIRRVLGEATVVEEDNRAELLKRAVNVLSAANQNGVTEINGLQVQNLVHNGNVIGINAETGEWFVEQGESKFAAQVVDEINLRQNSLEMRGLPADLARTAHFNAKGEAVVSVSAGGRSYDVTFGRDGSYSAMVDGQEIKGDRGANLQDLKNQVEKAENPFADAKFEDLPDEEGVSYHEEPYKNGFFKVKYFDSSGQDGRVDMIKIVDANGYNVFEEEVDGSRASIDAFMSKADAFVEDRGRALAELEGQGINTQVLQRIGISNYYDQSLDLLEREEIKFLQDHVGEDFEKAVSSLELSSKVPGVEPEIIFQNHGVVQNLVNSDSVNLVPRTLNYIEASSGRDVSVLRQRAMELVGLSPNNAGKCSVGEGGIVRVENVTNASFGRKFDLLVQQRGDQVLVGFDGPMGWNLGTKGFLGGIRPNEVLTGSNLESVMQKLQAMNRSLGGSEILGDGQTADVQPAVPAEDLSVAEEPVMPDEGVSQTGAVEQEANLAGQPASFESLGSIFDADQGQATQAEIIRMAESGKLGTGADLREYLRSQAEARGVNLPDNFDDRVRMALSDPKRAGARLNLLFNSMETGNWAEDLTTGPVAGPEQMEFSSPVEGFTSQTLDGVRSVDDLFTQFKNGDSTKDGFADYVSSQLEGVKREEVLAALGNYGQTQNPEAREAARKALEGMIANIKLRT